MQYGSLNSLKADVEKNGGVLTVLVEQVRNAHGADRLGSQIREEIVVRLNLLGLEYRPTIFPHYQEDEVRLFVRDSSAGRLIRAAERIGTNTDKRLQAAAKGEAILQEIRDLIGPT